jgi:hypothetical protein
MLYSKGGISNRRSSSGRLASKVKLVVAAMANFSLNKIPKIPRTKIHGFNP